jgi:RND superfamily putative drug exporter
VSSALYRWGRTSAAHPWRVLLASLVVVLGVLGLAGVTGAAFDDEFSIPGTESQQGLDALEQRFPQAAGTSAQVVVVAPEGSELADAANRSEVEDLVARLADVEHVDAATDPFSEGGQLSDDGRYALIQVQLDSDQAGVTDATIEGLEDAVALPEGSQLRTSLGGQALQVQGVHLSITEALGVVVALVVLALTFGSALAAGIPLVTALIGVAVGMGGLVAATAVTSVNSSSPTLALMIGLAVGIDYALFVVSRHRATLAEGVGVHEAIARSLATAGSAVVFAGATVVIALLGLGVAQIPFLTVMGAAAAATVAVAVVVALTVLPAILSLFGERLRPEPSRFRRHTDDATRTTLGARWVALVTRRPLITTLLVVVALGLVAVPAKDMHLALPDNGTSEEGSGARVTYELVQEGFGEGFNSPLLLTADIITTTDPLGVMADIQEQVEALPGVADVPLATPNESADTGLVQIVPETGGTDEATAALVDDLRALAPELEEQHGISDVRVTGATALQIDVSTQLGAALVPFGLVVMGLSLLLLMVVFRSIWVPVKATFGFLLSVLAAFGVIGAVYSWGWGADLLNATTGPVISFLPIILMGVLFGLAMDYEVFLVSRMREDYVHTGDAKGSVRTGFVSSARVVTAAAVIMIAVFAAFVPSGDTIIQPIALGLAVGVFVDAFVVRMTLVPAVLTLLGHRAWWLPRWLDRLLPSLDIEGEALAHHLDHEAWVERHGPVAVRAAGVGVEDADGTAVLRDVHLTAAPRTVLAVVDDDPVARRTLLAVLAGRVRPTSGDLVVLDRVLPEEQGAVLARTAFLRDDGRSALVVLDGAEHVAAARRVVESGRTAVLGCTAADLAAIEDVVGSDHLVVGRHDEPLTPLTEEVAR